MDTANYRGKFYVLSIDESDPDALTAPEKDIKGFNEYRFYKGKWIEDWPEDITFWFTKGEHVEDLMVGGGHWVLFSERVRQVFEQYKIAGVQFLPVKVFSQKTGVEVGKYWVMNVMQEVEGLDWTRTIWTTSDIKKIDEYPLLSILLPALVWEKVQCFDIFRLKVRGKGGTTVFVSERLKKCLENAGATSGMAFLPRKAY